MACFSPQNYTSSKNFYQPCGKCDACLKARRAKWTTKLLLESKSSNNQVIFSTLTYDDDHLPQKEKFTGGSLSKEDAQLFIKRLKTNFTYKYPDSKPLKYFIVGEYGSSPGSTYRAHYHFLLFHVDPQQHDIETIIRKSWTLGQKIDVQLIGAQKMLKNTIKTFSGSYTNTNAFEELVKSIKYTSKYLLKANGDKSGQLREKEFSLKSTQYPLGASYFKTLAPKIKKHNLYPTLGLSSWHRFLWEDLYITNANEDMPQAINWNGAFIMSTDSGAIDPLITDWKINTIKRQQATQNLKPFGFICNLDQNMQRHLLQETYPDLTHQLDYYYSLHKPDEKQSLAIKYKIYQTQLGQKSKDNYLTFRNDIVLDHKGKPLKYPKIQQDKMQFYKQERREDASIKKL